MPDRPFTKEILDQYLKELAKEYRRINGKSMPAEIILIGGASVIMNYGFREMTYDTDALIHAASSMKEAINNLGIGPAGLGGRNTALAVNVNTYPTHIAGLPVAINICCHVNRHCTEIL